MTLCVNCHSPDDCLICLPSGDRGDPGPVGISSPRPPMLNLWFKGEKGSRGSAGSDGFPGPRGAEAGDIWE